MKVRGRRRCKECGQRWSYFETGSAECPTCGSVNSVGVDDERRLHTDSPAELDLSEARAGVDERPLREVASAATDAARSYYVARGFVDAGELRPLDDVFLAAAELRHAATAIRRALDVSDEEELYFLSLLSGAEAGGRPDEVPESLRAARGLGAADAVEAYREDVADWLEGHEDPAARRVLEQLRERERRISALDGEVPGREADRLVETARDLGAYLREGDEGALARARERLSAMD